MTVRAAIVGLGRWGQRPVSSVEGGANFPVSPAQAVHGVAVVEAIIRSAASGRPVEIA